MRRLASAATDQVFFLRGGRVRKKVFYFIEKAGRPYHTRLWHVAAACWRLAFLLFELDQRDVRASLRARERKASATRYREEIAGQSSAFAVYVSPDRSFNRSGSIHRALCISITSDQSRLITRWSIVLLSAGKETTASQNARRELRPQD